MSEVIRIRGIAAGGDGVGNLADGRAVFVPRTAPGDLVELAAVRASKRLAHAEAGRLIEPSPDRVAPPCPHYTSDRCGGCQLQHLVAAAQRNARSAIVREALRRIGHVDPGEVPLVPSDAEWGYRAKITLAVGGRRIGFHPVGRAREVFDLGNCPVARPELNALWAAVSARRRLLPRHAEQLVLRIDRAGGLHLLVRVRGTEVWTDAASLGRALREAGLEPVLWWEPEGGAARAVWGAREAYPAMVFEQIHPAMGDLVRAHAVASLGALEGRHCWDLYAGIGETTRALLAGGATVESVELDRRAVMVAEGLGPSEGVRRIAGRVEDALRHLRAPDLVVVNPPRTGLGADVATGLLAHSPTRLAYVSCDPATLARDLARLAERWAVAEIRAFDLFPQTAHVETVARLEAR